MIRPVDPALLLKGSFEDPRLGARVVSTSFDDVLPVDVAIVGCADDTGIANSGGRTGAASGPTELRRWLYKSTTGLEHELAHLNLLDLGDVLPGDTIEATHAEVERVVARAFERARTVVFLGGGHDLAFASTSGLLSARSEMVALVNLDTHLDVRPLKEGRTITSGTPFRRVIERWQERVLGYSVLAAQPQHNAAAHLDWIRRHNGDVQLLESLRARREAGPALVDAFTDATRDASLATLSLDLDVFAAAFAPGVSAPPADGLAPHELQPLLDLAGRDGRVALLEVMELSPPHDENGKTARLGAWAIWRFLAGRAPRDGQPALPLRVR